MKKNYFLLSFTILLGLFANAQISGLEKTTSLFSEDFTYSIPGNWTITNGGEGDSWYWDEGVAHITSWASYNTVGELISPDIDITGNDHVFIGFDSYLKYFGSETVTVEAWDGSEWQMLDSYNAIHGTSVNGMAHMEYDVSDYINAEFAVKFYYNTNYVLSDDWYIDNVSVFVPDDKDLGLYKVAPMAVQLGADADFSVTVHNWGYEDQAAFDVELIITDANNVEVYHETVSNPAAIISNEDITVEFPVWTAPEEGVYSMNATVTMTGDMNAENDVLTGEFKVLDEPLAYGVNATQKQSTSVFVPSGDEEYIAHYETLSGDEWTSTFEFAADGKCYYMKNGGEFGTINTETGETTIIGMMSGIEHNGAVAMAYNWVNHQMYVVCYNWIYLPILGTIDLETGHFSQIGQGDDGRIIAMDFDNEGNLYALDHSENLIWNIDIETGAISLVGGLAMDIGLGQDISFDRESGIMYGMLYDYIEVSSKLSSIDLNTGEATQLHSMGSHYACFGIEADAEEVYTARFNVMNAENEPVEHAQIIINGVKIETNSDGAATRFLAPGTYEYTVDGNGYHEYTGTVTVSNEDVDIDVTLASCPVYLVEFTLVSMEGAPVAWAGLFINGNSLWTDESGVCFLMLEDGTYDYYTEHYQFERQDHEVTVAGNDVYTEIVLLPWGHHKAEFIVTNSNGDPLENAQITMNNETLYTDENGMTFFALQNGTYDYSITMDGYDEITGSVEIADEDVYTTINLLTTGIFNDNTIEFNIYPNPAQDYVTITGNEAMEVEVYDVVGEVVKNARVSASEHAINISDLPKGNYIFMIKTANENHTRSIIKL